MARPFDYMVSTSLLSRENRIFKNSMLLQYIRHRVIRILINNIAFQCKLFFCLEQQFYLRQLLLQQLQHVITIHINVQIRPCAAHRSDTAMCCTSFRYSHVPHIVQIQPCAAHRSDTAMCCTLFRYSHVLHIVQIQPCAAHCSDTAMCCTSFRYSHVLHIVQIQPCAAHVQIQPCAAHRSDTAMCCTSFRYSHVLHIVQIQPCAAHCTGGTILMH